MKSNKCVILIPIYKEFVNFDEYRSIHNTMNLYHDKYDIYFLCNEKLNISMYKKYFKNIDYKFFNYKDIWSYSNLLMTRKFYKKFLNYEYMLIAQHDAYIFNTYTLEYFLDKNYNYIGALYNIYGIEHKLYKNNILDKFYNDNYTIGDIKKYLMKNNFITEDLNNAENYNTNNDMFFGMNGGFSLRKIDVICNLLKEDFEYFWFEDGLICSLLDKYSLLDNILFSDIMKFSYESEYFDGFYKKTKILPYSLHKYIYEGYKNLFSIY